MDLRDAVALIGPAVRGRKGPWADLGAGDGTFTRALTELLGRESLIYAVDRDASAIGALAKWAARSAPNVVAVQADFTRELPQLRESSLDGMLLANALHFVRDAEGVLTRLTRLLRPSGRLVLVEYDRRAASRWVPYPIPTSRLPSLARSAGLSEPAVVGTMPSLYSGVLYAAAADRLP